MRTEPFETPPPDHHVVLLELDDYRIIGAQAGMILRHDDYLHIEQFFDGVNLILHRWCQDNCDGSFDFRATEWKFTSKKDAALFKLFHKGVV